MWNVVSLHYVIIVKIKKFESVERECDDLDVGLMQYCITYTYDCLSLTSYNSVSIIARALATLGGGLKGERHTHNKQV